MPDHTPPPLALDSLDVPDWERRGALRRTDDRSLVARCRALASDASKLIVVAATLVGIVAWFGMLLGVKLQGPPQTIATVIARQDSIAVRVTRLEAGAVQTHEQLRDLTTDIRFLSYQQCVTTRTHDPIAQDRCQAILDAVRGSR